MTATDTGTDLYWSVVARRACHYADAVQRPGADLLAGVEILRQHAADFDEPHPDGNMGLLRATHITQLCLLVVVHEDAPAAVRTREGLVDLDRLLPVTSSALTVLDAASSLTRLFPMPPTQAMEAAEAQIAATDHRSRAVVQKILSAPLYGPQGRERALDALWELRNDPRALSGVLALNAAVLQAVRPC
ncbi:hypothetical protein ACWDXD_24705 [Streptomyces sp. NPDC003314]